MAGWIGHDPGALSWMPPSRLLAHPASPPGGFRAPLSDLIDKWGPDLILFGLLAIGTIAWIALATVRRSPLRFVYYGAVVLIVLHVIGAVGPDPVILVFRVIAIVSLAIGIGLSIRGRRIAIHT